MIGKNKIKYIRSLELRKNREHEGVFVAEGPKVVADLMAVARPVMTVGTEEWFASRGAEPGPADAVVTDDELRRASFLQHPQQVMALFPLPRPAVGAEACGRGLCLALDKVQDPGNLGTIIRVADWFGISTIFCAKGTADAFSPKAVQATMGSIARVSVVYTDLCALIDALPPSVPVYATSLDGRNIYEQELSANGLIVMGNEGNGVSPEVAARAGRSVYIPSYSPTGAIDSLNVAIATAVTCAEFRRRCR